MAKMEKLPEGVEMLVKRHAAVAGTEVGTAAINSMKKLTNADPSEGVWNPGDQFTVPPADLIDQAAFVAAINGNKAPAVAVHCENGQDKVLYLSTLKKNVVVYEETEDGYVTKKKADGTAETHFAGEETGGSPLRKEIMSKATVGDILMGLAGRTFKVASVMGPYKTSRLKATYNAAGQRDGYEVVGLRNTSIPVFEEVK
jgi:hypothetical protein